MYRVPNGRPMKPIIGMHVKVERSLSMSKDMRQENGSLMLNPKMAKMVRNIKSVSYVNVSLRQK